MAVLLMLLIMLCRRRLKNKKEVAYAIELTPNIVPTPYFDNNNPFVTPSASLKTLGKSTAPVAPVHHRAPSSTEPPSEMTVSSNSQHGHGEPDLDGIVERLARRFGWTIPQHADLERDDVVSSDDTDHLPRYQDPHV